MHKTGLLLSAGWKSVSLVDIHGYSAFTLWLCGCNLNCPFCHNWRLTINDPEYCKQLDISKIVEEVYNNRILIDYLHVTGGEPLLQYTGLEQLFIEMKDMGIPTSLNSNLTLYEPFKYLVEKELISHVATDLKVPPEELYGIPVDLVGKLWLSFIKSLELIKQYNIPLELRIPVYKNLTIGILKKRLEEVIAHLSPNKTIIVLNPLLGKPYTTPRRLEWCNIHCNPLNEQLEELASIIKPYGFSKLIIRSIPGFKT